MSADHATTPPRAYIQANPPPHEDWLHAYILLALGDVLWAIDELLKKAPDAHGDYEELRSYAEGFGFTLSHFQGVFEDASSCPMRDWAAERIGTQRFPNDHLPMPGCAIYKVNTERSRQGLPMLVPSAATDAARGRDELAALQCETWTEDNR